MKKPESLNLATLFADVVGSTRLYERFGDAIAHAAIEGCLDELKKITTHFGGRTVKTIGDEIMAVFPSAEAVCQAAIEMQWRVAELPSVDTERLAIRIGYHFGAAVERDDDVFGDSVNVAARITEIANGEQIITSVQSLEGLPLQLASYARHLWPVSVKGKSEPVDLFEILWNGGSDATMTVSAHFEPERIPVRLRLIYQGTEVAVDPGRPAVSIGRDPGNELVVDAPNTSRVHARVEWRVDKFVLVDLSTNGTYVLTGEDQETNLRREELILNGDGAISLGLSNRVNPRDQIQFVSEYMGASSRAVGRSQSATGAKPF